MKILSYAIDIKSWKHKLTCYWCKTELEISIDDVMYSGEAGDWHDSGWEKYEVACPECNVRCDIPPVNIHNLIKAKIQLKNKNGSRNV